MNAIVLFYPRVQLFTKGWPTHTKNIGGEKVAAVTAAATVLCAKQQHNHCAAPDFPGFVQTVRFAQKTFIFYLIQAIFVW